jgi:hypothetical protein
MAHKPKTLTRDGTGVAAVPILEEKFIRELMELYRADHPQSIESDAALYRRLRHVWRSASPRPDFETLQNLPTSKALELAMRDRLNKAGALLEEHYAQQGLVEQGRIQKKRSEVGNEAQAMARLADLPDGHPLKQATTIAERDQLIREHAQRLMRDHPNLKPADIKRKVGKWAQMGAKQIGRILQTPER